MKRFLVFSFSLLTFSFLYTPFVFAQTPSVGAGQQGSDFTATSPCVQTQVGNAAGTPTPPPGCDPNSSAGSYALKVVKAITNLTTCADSKLAAKSFGISTDTDYTSPQFRSVSKAQSNCLDAIDPSAPTLGLTDWQTVKTDLKAIPSQSAYLQCVGFVNAVLKGANKTALIPESNAQDYAAHTTDYPIYQWFDNTDQNLDNLKAGDTVIFRGGQFGHIAIVVGIPVIANIPVRRATFNVAEGNGNLVGDVDLQQYTSNGVALHLLGWFRKK